MAEAPIVALRETHLEAYVEHERAAAAESNAVGAIISTPYGRDEPFDADTMRTRTRERWTTPLDAIGWRRAWGVFDGAALIASTTLTGGGLRSELHRVTLGMSVLHPHRRRGHGRRLLAHVIDWCRAEPGLAWLDLGVFAANGPAIALYESFDFERTGEVRDRFRVNGASIDDIGMTLSVTRARS